MFYVYKINKQHLLLFGEIFHTKLRNYLQRYIDDCFASWQENIDRLTKFKIIVKVHKNNIQITLNFNPK